MKSGQRGISLLELTVSFTVIVALMWVFAERVRDYVRISEQTAVRQTLATLRTAMNMEVIRLAGAGDLRGVEALTGQNPVRWLAQPPDGYLGEISGRQTESAPGGSWYFETDRKQLVYVPRRFAWGEELPEDGVFRFEVRATYAGGTAKGAVPGLSAIELVTVGATPG